MKRLGLLVLFWWLFVPDVLYAQTPEPRPNVPLLQTGGVYGIGCTPTAPMDNVVQACWVRTDVTPIVELGCVDATPPDTAHLDFSLTMSIGEVAEIRCYMVTDLGVPSDYSENAGIVDFTRPGRPFVVP